ncbi:cell division protein ZipN [Synechococcus sp. WH 8101]|nr:cell division protein ZipN [Synechococcus sp. WH 8101]
MPVDLPIDHFRLLGVSPSAESETILRTLQLRIDRSPDQGFTHEGLQQRADLLRLSADLLTDPTRRRDYEAALMELGRDHPGETAGLEVASSREVGGLILLWEANAPHEAFQLACQALQPPQAPALGSGREADLALLAALASRAAAEQDQEQRRYESAAGLLGEGLQLLQRVGKLPDQRLVLEQRLEQLKPYRILDLLSRDLSEQQARSEGLDLLDQLVQDRGGLEGLDQGEIGLSQGEFELFFQQIRRFLTVQEQIDLFERWQGLGSSDAAFLAVMAFSAAGFSRRKPERLDEARQRLRDLPLEGLDTHPLQACLDLLLGDVDHAMTQMRASADSELQTWLKRHPGDDLAALCDYCRSWLRRDVLPGYRDVDADAVDLEAWFADRDVQAFVERLERVQGRRLPEPAETWSPTDPYPAFPLDPDGTLPLAIPSPPNASPSAESDRGAEVDGEAPPSWRERLPLDRFSPARFQVGRPWLLGSVVFVLLVAVAAAFALVGLRRESESESPPTPPPSTPVQARLKPEADPAPASLKPLEADAPSEAQLQTLLQAWLDRKARVLAGSSQADAQLETVARDGLIQQLKAERQADAAAGARQTVKATITSVEVVSRSPQRIELRARVAYSDQRLDADGKVIERTPPTTLPVTYILGRDGRAWRLHAYITG